MSLLAWPGIEEVYARHAQLKPEDVALLEEWQRHQPHLPAPLHPIEAAHFLHCCSYSNEASKKRIDAFYTFRTHCPEFFANRDPFGPEVQLALDTWMVGVLPDQTPEGYAVIYMRLQDHNPDMFNFSEAVKIVDMMVNVACRYHRCLTGNIIVIDLEGITIRHLLKSPVLSVKRVLNYLQTGVPIIIKSLHFVNGVPFMDKVLALMRPFMGKEFRDLLHVHYGDNSSIYKFVPKEILPIECGGLGLSAADYYRNVARKEIENHSEYFKVEEHQLVDESKRPGTPGSHNLFGVEGTFKKLNVD